MPGLQFSTALITGASSGIGEAIARELAKQNVALVLVARSGDKLESLAAELSAGGLEVIPIAQDLLAGNADEVLWNELQRRNIKIDMLINNAGFGGYGFFHDSPIEKQIEMIDLNIKALVKLTYRFLPPMISNNHGAIMNVSSTASFQPVPFMAAYAATKAFVTNFTVALSSEYQDTHVRFIALCPGRTKTNFQVAAGSQKVRIRSRAATPQQVARVAVKALRRNNNIAIEGFMNHAMIHLQRFFPRWFIIKIAHKIFKPKNIHH
ncbi:SDR family oxidoreductase [bacterium]|nr:MAG: SDR family oxidoreductase [bacterium]